MFLNKKVKKVIKVFWMILGVLIIISMVLLYTPIFSQPSHTAPVAEPLSNTVEL